MAMRVGEMMVIVRAQDFASRTLRRVGGEFAHLSREQQMAFRRQQLAWQRYDARASKFAANEMARQVELAERYRSATKAVESSARVRERLQGRLARAQLLSARAFDAARDPKTGRVGAPGAAHAMAGRAVRAYQQDLQRLAEVESQQLTRQNRLQQVLQKTPVWVQRASQSAYGMASAYGRVNTALEQAHRNLTVAQQSQLAYDQAVRRLPVNRLHELGSAMGGVGRTMQLFGAVTTVALGASARAAANFNKEISLAATQARDIDAPASQVATRIDQLTNGFEANGKQISGVLDLMNRFPAAQSEMAASAYDIFSSMDLENDGIINVVKGMNLLEDANKLAVAGGVELTDATSALVTVLNNFDPTLKNVNEQYDTMFDIVRFGRMTLSEFNIMMNKIAPAANEAGNSLEDVGGAMAYLTTTMPSQRMVATGISRLMEALRRPAMVKGLKKIGIEALSADGHLRPLPDLLQDIAKTFPQLTSGQMSTADFFQTVSSMGQGGKGVIFTQEGRRALAQLLTHMDEYLDAQNRIEQNQGEFGASLEAQMKTLGVQWDIFINRIRALAIAIGTDAIPVFQEMSEIIGRMLDAWQGLDPEIRKNIIRFAAIAGVATLIGGIFLAMIGAVLGLEAGLRSLFMRGTGTLGMLKGLQMVLSRIAAIAAISLMIKVAMTGEATAMDLIMGMVAGGILGAAFGPAGIVAGGIIVPLTLKLLSDRDNVNVQVPKWMENSKSPMVIAYREYLEGAFKRAFDEGVRPMSWSEWRKHIDAMKIPDNIDRREGFRQNISTLQQEGKLLGAKTTATNKFAAAMTKYIQQEKKYAEQQKQYKEDYKQHTEAMKDYNQNLSTATVDAHRQAVDSARSMYSQLEDLNRTAMGELFKGPFLTSESFDLAKEWGVTASINELTRDLNAANARFRKWRSGLDSLMKRGVPDDMVQELRQMGPEEGQAYVDAILKGTPQQRDKLITAWKQRNKQVQSATKMDFVDEIERFRKAGVNMGTAIISGFKEAQVGKWFDSWVQTKFPSVINASVNQAVAQWKEQNPRPVAPKAPMAPKRPVPPPNVKAATANKPTSQSNDNSHTQTINIHMGDSAATARDKRDEERRLGFAIRNATRRRGGI